MRSGPITCCRPPVPRGRAAVGQEEGLHPQPQDERPAVAMELDDVLAGIASGRLHDRNQDFVDALAARRAQLAVVQGVRLVVTDGPAGGAGKDP